MIDRGIVLIGFRAGDKRTTVSLDDVLFEYLARRLGGPDAARQWIAHEAEMLYAINAESDVRSGVSRLVQRRALRLLLDGDPAGVVGPAGREEGLAVDPPLVHDPAASTGASEASVEAAAVPGPSDEG